MSNLKSLIKAKKFSEVNKHIQQYDILDLFPPTEVRSKEYECFTWSTSLNFEECKERMYRYDYEPANLREMLLWPDWKEKDMVVALGSKCTIEGEEYVPCMEMVWECDGKNCWKKSRLVLFNTKLEWPAGVLFLAVKI